MPPDPATIRIARLWLQCARGNLIRASAPRSPGVYWEDICFDAQQAAEKALKAVLVYYGISLCRVHDLAELLTLGKSEIAPLPARIRAAAGLTVYAVQTRYPGTYPPVTAREARQATRTAERVVVWVEGSILFT